MNFTENQQNAIEIRDCSLIISAGAGSGKTAVLTERILERICDENDDCNINDFLIVTFSRMAARELNDRIRKKLSERAGLYPGNKKIIRNLALMPLAKIMTINAFCYELVRENFQKLGISASVRIADEAETTVIREKLMNEIVDEYFEKHGDDKAFIAAYEIFSSSKDDGGFIATLLNLAESLSNIADRDGFCSFAKKSYEEIADGGEFFDTSYGKKVKSYIQKSADRTMKNLEKLMNACSGYDVLLDKYYPVIEHEFEFARSVYHACDRGYGELYSVVSCHTPMNFKGRNIPSSFENKALKEKIASAKGAVADSFYKDIMALTTCDGELLKVAARDSGMIISKLLEIVMCFEERLLERKKELSILEFSDAERFTLSLLVKSIEPFRVTELAKSMRERYKEIYIDEYQDVNPLQDMIFRAISRQRKDGEYNRFMVGDLKQSIYRFRGARSEIFMSYRDSFRDIEEDADARRIFMNDNFRCSKNVIGFTNLLFGRLMGDIYTDGDKLKFSREEKNGIDKKVKLCAFSFDKVLHEGLSVPELEAAYIASQIKEIVANPKYTDSEGRMYGFKDIGILAKNRAVLKVYEKVLNDCGIPSSCSVGESFYGKKEIILCIDILNAIDNPERDIYLAGFMRSFAGSFTDDELAIIKNSCSKMSLYRAVKSFSENGGEGYEKLSRKCSEFVEMLREYRTYSRGKSADKLLWKLYTDMDIINFCSSPSFTNDGAGAARNLLKLYQLSRDFSKTSFRGIGAFIDYIDSSIKNSELKSERENNGECVSIMTIHASKGLEFPVCFVSNLSKDFTRKDQKRRLCCLENSGISVKLCDTEGIESTDSQTGLVSIETPFRAFAVGELDRDMLDEEIRVLYVAVTRARDMLILTSSFSKKVEGALKEFMGIGYGEAFSECSDYFDMIMSSLIDESVMAPFYEAAGKDFDISGYDAEKYLECVYLSPQEMKTVYDNTVIGTEQEGKTCSEDDIDNALLEKLTEIGSFSPKHTDIPSKITVSRLKKGLIDEETERMTSSGKTDKEEILPLFVTGEKTADGAEKGTAMHMFMQFAKYENCESDCNAEADRLLRSGFIDKRQRELLDMEKLERFFSSEFYKSFRESGCIYREQRFNLDLSAFDTTLGGDVLVQGVIDLFYENDDGTYSVVDFKTDRVYGDGAEEILIERHREQLMYYKRAVEEMTGKSVRDVIIYSFSLMKEITVE